MLKNKVLDAKELLRHELIFLRIKLRCYGVHHD